MTTKWKYSPEEIFAAGPVVPVLVINDVEKAVPLAKALMEGGIKVLEVTLRTPAAIDVIKRIAEEVPDSLIGAGTVTNAQQLKAVVEAGAKFAISPGMTADLLKAGMDAEIPLIPGISSTSDLMKGKDAGYTHMKFFPAEASGGVKAIKSISGPFPDVTFCPTGGIGPNNYNDYLALNNVKCVGGSWLAPDDAIEAGDWARITQLAKEAVAGANQ
ncbi:bifunctional 4-hydroxy-2-oxoglutarate aldolase/2-dehydro-3-deoxy-phosphogluconate aldolase [Alteromonas sp. DY56-G5]|jgi:2-dehydro-3-deoxyphosphogluconate aldolase/(4S)-4-hydroxy-2-oxoglutarate aldolase|uniref:bifunctional 4-hydroxy-2-oxoglutarate aldolase/2-dehydro-3-deoxy-phosphogluconate aldolase n=2 Tax=Pseudomonadota TaxID=1224 RepID=UPI00029879AF|nr:MULTISPECIES: bifunctional 4-hydroxy-2-oxoglutarate aldolase/2-dehydro-3-deoxy-phosphogluconate aldolase [Gammaproteobacteria]MEC9060901.1 bifunctional 4-hydroxy-2-oxoglutarate aldolase/2-dehydro-3-deoxy-phosphogluconate aldolase [Pseudomonadota bacterium]AFV85950.1 keto-hydroxyglutarate-aldolase/keto-deoxy-phosphogluconate aldolase [Alteromonas mediterranea DE1]AFV87535.1 keto-hydroxyglutarate-aldolase/keto-deoxy-phosphogluconate aldolase [Alteromonas mediterranea DE1]AGP97961.1 keto-hydrox|tara:strand:+ start:23 stop:667 length:645 start_codon:yes stop_codon:yes gene_type:complete